MAQYDYEQNGTAVGYMGALSSAYSLRIGIHILTGHALIGTSVSSIKLQLNKQLSPTGTATICIRDLATDTIQTSTTLDVSTLTGTKTVYTFNFTPRTIVAGDRINIEFSGGDASNYVNVWGGTTSIPANTAITSYHGGAYDADNTSQAAYGIIVGNPLISNALTLVESVTKIIAKSISDSISLSGEKVNKSINKTISDTLSISDTVHISKVLQSVSDDILTADTVSISKGIIRSVVDNLSAGDIISKSLGKQINDSPSLSDVLSKNINKILSDNLSLVDIVSKNITKLIVENPSFLDSTGQSKTLVRQITDALSILESVVVAKQITTKIIDNLLSGDSMSKNIGKLLQDNPTLAEQLSKAISKIITDNISIPDSVTKNIGSLLLNQTRRINLNNTTQQMISEGKPRNVTI